MWKSLPDIPVLRKSKRLVKSCVVRDHPCIFTIMTVACFHISPHLINVPRFA